MTPRLAIAALLALAAASGCTTLQDDTISLVAQKPVLSRWPFKRSPPPRASQKVHSGDTQQPPHAPATPLPEAFLESLPADLRNRIESDLKDAGPEDRQRLLSYLATVDPARIPALLDARSSKKSEPPPETSPVITAAAEGSPELVLTADELPGRQVEPVSARTVFADEAPQSTAAEPLPTPMPRPRRNPLIEIQGVEFEDAAVTDGSEEVTPTAAALEQQNMPGPVITPQAPASDSPPSANPLAKLKEWTTIRKSDPGTAAAPPPVQTAQVPTDPLSLQSLSRRLLGASKTETASLPLDELPPAADESPHLHDALQRLIALMEAETARLKPGTSFAEREEYVRRHAELRMLLLMSRQPTLALQAIPDVDPETQEFWTSLIWSMSNYFDNESSVDPAERAAAALERLRAAEQHLQSTARLELKSLVFCDKIDGFGSYHPFEQNLFRPSQEVLLYAEVRNFKTEVTAAGRYRTSLRSTIEIVKAGDEGELIERRHLNSTEDQSRSPRTDYFHSYKLDLPPHLTPGTYALKLTLEDELSGKIGAASIDFQVR